MPVPKINNKKNGFTLIELMVIVAIMLIMTSVIFFNYNKFNSDMLLNNFAYDLSLSIRQAQVYGVATKESSSATAGGAVDSSTHSSSFLYAYGVHFDIASSTNFKLFVDNVHPSFGTYDTSPDEALQTYTFQKGVKIKEMCVDEDDYMIGTPCASFGGSSVSKLDITFLRPNPEARIAAFGATDTVKICIIDPQAGKGCSRAAIVLQNTDNSARKVVVISSTGQISVQKATDSP